MKNLLFSFFITILPFIGFSQITYNSSDLLQPGDTLRYSTALTTGGIDVTLTGNNYNWDFSNLTAVSQRIDTFISVGSSPATYQFYFNNGLLYPNNKATVVGLEESMDTVSMYQITNIHNFYREKNNKFELVGYGGELNGMGIPIKFDTNDIIYHLPISVNSQPDSSHSSYALAIPGLGYVGQTKKRVVFVDGWGTLTTPFGTFNTIRIKSNIYQEDSVKIDSMPFPLPALKRNIVEYSWLAKGYGKPILKVSTILGIPSNIEYVDSVRTNLIGLNEYKRLKESIRVYPNPTFGKVKIVAPNELNSFSVKVLDSKGATVYQKEIKQNQSLIDLKLEEGLYFMVIKTVKNQSVHKIIIKSH